MGKIGSLIKLKAEDPSKVEKIVPIAKTLSMHIAAMKPKYLGKNDIPKEVYDKTFELGQEKALKKLYTQEVLYDQDLAISDESKTIKQYLKE